MELDVNTSEASVVDGVETVEVIAGGEDAVNLGSSSAAATLMDQHIAGVANPQEILVPTSEVQIEGQALDQALLAHGTPIITIPVGPPSPPVATQQMLVGTKRSHPEALTTVTESLMTVGTGTSVSIDSLPINAGGAASQPSPDVPRKKSRNYLDSHKTIEKKRRDRINSCLDQLKNLVPDCRQYGSKKLDKAEILEMSIEYIQRMQNQGLGGKTPLGGLDINMSQREWANDLTTWVIQNKMVHTGANALEGFCQSLLLHLQSMGSGNALASATSMLLNQASAAAAASASEDDALFRQQTTVNTQVALLQQIQQQQQQQQQSAAVSGAAATTTTTKDAAAGTVGGGVVGGETNGGGGGGASAAAVTVGGGATGSSTTGAGSANQQTQTQQQLQQAQLTQLQALLLLQQQQQLLNQQQQQETDAQSQQLQQLQQLQALLLQHIANEASSSTSTTASGGSTSATGSADSADSVGGGVSGGETTTSKSDGTQTTHALQVDDASSVLTGSNPMTGEGATSAGLSDDHPTVELSQPSEEELAETTEEAVYTTAISQMWSSAGSAQAGQGSSLLILGGGSESEGEGVGGINGRPGGKSSLIETSEVQEEVELLSQQEH